MTRLDAGRLKNRGSIPVRAKELESSPKRPDRPWYPASLHNPKLPQILSQWLKRPGREVDQSLPSNSEVMNAWKHSLFPPTLSSPANNQILPFRSTAFYRQFASFSIITTEVPRLHELLCISWILYDIRV